jgi:DhnA family fructose-bisphosphate aldolase class Ia
LSDFGKQLRLNRILGRRDRRPLVVAFDHALPLGPIPGTINPAFQVRSFVEGGADSVLLNPGMIRHCMGAFLHPSAPSLIVRMDWSSLWTSLGMDGKLRSESVATPEQALRHGADAVLSYLMMGTGDVDFEAKEIGRNAEIARECEQLGVPLIVESLARGKILNHPTRVAAIKFHTRVAAELGADVIKTEYTGDAESMAEVVHDCPLPVLVLGGERKNSDEEAFSVLRTVVRSGVRGVFFGRNVFQAPNIVDFLRKARTILDENQAIDALQENSAFQ